MRVTNDKILAILIFRDICRISLTVTAWSEDQETNVDKLKVEIAHSLLDIGQLLECARTK